MIAPTDILIELLGAGGLVVRNAGCDRSIAMAQRMAAMDLSYKLPVAIKIAITLTPISAENFILLDPVHSIIKLEP